MRNALRLASATSTALLILALALVVTRPGAPVAPPATATAIATAAETAEVRLPDTAGTPSPSPSPSRLPAVDALRIAIPRLGIDLPLAMGDIGRDVPQGSYPGNTPEHVALVFPGSAPLASGGNTYIYAHARVGMFLSLWNVQLGDAVVIFAPDNDNVALRYSISQIQPRVSASDTTWLDPKGPERLTLQTSTGPNPGDPRFIAIAIPVPASPPR